MCRTCMVTSCIINYYVVNFVTHIATHKYVASMLYKVFSLIAEHGLATSLYKKIPFSL
jgi:hypothetical protein